MTPADKLAAAMAGHTTATRTDKPSAVCHTPEQKPAATAKRQPQRRTPVQPEVLQPVFRKDASKDKELRMSIRLSPQTDALLKKCATDYGQEKTTVLITAFLEFCERYGVKI